MDQVCLDNFFCLILKSPLEISIYVFPKVIFDIKVNLMSWNVYVGKQRGE